MFYKWERAFISQNICLVIAQADVSYHAGPHTMMDFTPDLSRFTHLLVKSCTRMNSPQHVKAKMLFISQSQTKLKKMFCVYLLWYRMIYSALQNNCNSNGWS